MDKTYLIKQLKELSDRFHLGIPEAAIEKAISFSRFKVYSKGEMIGRSGDNAETAGIVLSGVIRSYYVDKDGSDITQYFAPEGSWCIDSGMVGFDELRYKIYRENGFLVETATERYIAFRKRNPELAERVPLRYIATYLGITPESLSRITEVFELKRDGIRYAVDLSEEGEVISISDVSNERFIQRLLPGTLIRLGLTIAGEFIIALFFCFFKKRELLTVLITNVVTNSIAQMLSLFLFELYFLAFIRKLFLCIRVYRGFNSSNDTMII